MAKKALTCEVIANTSRYCQNYYSEIHWRDRIIYRKRIEMICSLGWREIFQILDSERQENYYLRFNSSTVLWWINALRKTSNSMTRMLFYELKQPMNEREREINTISKIYNFIWVLITIVFFLYFLSISELCCCKNKARINLLHWIKILIELILLYIKSLFTRDNFYFVWPKFYSTTTPKTQWFSSLF